MSNTNRAAFQGTKVSSGQTQGEIRDMLRAHGIQTQWTDESARAILRFIFKAYGKELIARVNIVYPTLKPQTRGRAVAPAVRAEREINRLFRCLLAWFKGQFAAIDAGLLTMAEAFTPFLELPDGRTVGQVIPALAVQGRLSLPAAAGPSTVTRAQA